MREQITNGAATTLDGSINNSVTTISVNDASDFPADGDFRIVVGDEIMWVTSVSGDDFTVVRGAEGTVADSHANSAPVEQILTRDGLEKLFQDNWTYVGDPDRQIMGIFDSSGAPLDSTDFTWVNQGGASVVDNSDGSINLRAPSNGAANGCRMLVRTAPVSTPYSIIAGFVPLLTGNGNGTNGFPSLIFGFRENSTGKLRYIGVYNTVNGIRINTQTASTATTGHSNDFTPINVGLTEDPLWLKITDNGTNLLFYWSGDGINWVLLFSVARTSHFTTDPDEIFWGTNLYDPISLDSMVSLVSWRE